MKRFRLRPEPSRRADVVFVNRFAWPDEAATSRMLSAVAFALAERGMRVEIITAKLSYTGYDEERAADQVERGVRITRVPTTRFGRTDHRGRLLDYLSFYVSMAWTLAWRCPGAKCVVAKTDPPLLGVPVYLIATLFGVRVVQWSQDVFPEVAQVSFRNPWWRLPLGLLRHLRDAAFRHSDLVVAIGRDMLEHYVRHGVWRSRLYCIENFADGERIKPMPHADNPLRTRWSLGGKFVLAYSGNLGRTHEVGVFCEAAVLLAQEPDICFLFIGGGASVERVRQRLPEYVLKRTRFEPYQPVSALSASLSVADVHWFSLEERYSDFIVPSKYYGVLAAGRPMVYVGRQQSALARELEEAGIGYAVEDAVAFRDAVLRLKLDTRLRAEMGKRARKQLESRADLRLRVDDWHALLERINNG